MANKALILMRRLEEALLALLLTAMIGVAAVQVVLRNFFDSGLYWGDSAVRVIVLWVAMLGAMVASRHDERIRRVFLDHRTQRLRELATVHTQTIVGGRAIGSAWVMTENRHNAEVLGAIEVLQPSDLKLNRMLACMIEFELSQRA